MHREYLEKVENFRLLGVDLAIEGILGVEVSQRIDEVAVLGALNSV